MHIWEQCLWPHFEWDESVLRPTLDAIRLLQGHMLGKIEALDVDKDTTNNRETPGHF